jgi:hypothetical protein
MKNAPQRIAVVTVLGIALVGFGPTAALTPGPMAASA